MIAEMLAQLHEPAPSFVEHVSIKCPHCNVRLEFNFSDDQDEAIELDNARHAAGWKWTMEGLSCPACARVVEWRGVL